VNCNLRARRIEPYVLKVEARGLGIHQRGMKDRDVEGVYSLVPEAKQHFKRLTERKGY
jgi:hypothetical protein